ncbi:testis-specific serine kinase substrate isoform X2 [Crotalus tigris]|uniref:testis-specific serine kinase substrate isoform X2 n=1 Tax=Crotalus tigris TaxID=88082 RepID=UPI00192F66E0|nr:testis-specific serine kinase substrate isoform X2 [Crotalus tigris]
MFPFPPIFSSPPSLWPGLLPLLFTRLSSVPHLLRRCLPVHAIKQSRTGKENSDAADGHKTAPISSYPLHAFPWRVGGWRVEPHFTSESPNLNLKRSSACTNVSLLNLTDGERDDSTTENESTDDGGLPGGAGGERRDPLFPIKPAWSEDEDESSSQQEVSNSGLLRAKDSITSLKERTSKVNHHLQNLQESCRKVTKSVEDAEIKTSVLEENSALLEEKLRNLQQQVQVEDFRWKCMLELAQKEALRLLAQLGVRLEGVLPQRERTQVEQGQELKMLREELDEVSTTAKRTSVSLTQLRTDLDGLLEDISRHLATLKNMEASDRPPSNCARCSSYSIVNTEVLRKMFEHAMAPVLEELKQRAQSEGICPSCQRLQKTMAQRGTE